jgi:hypothetical protein
MAITPREWQQLREAQATAAAVLREAGPSLQRAIAALAEARAHRERLARLGGPTHHRPEGTTHA